MLPDSPVVSESEEQTRALGAELGRLLEGGEVVFLSGDFGCGKTVFVKGIAESIGVSPTEVISPSFTLVQIYAGRLVLHHVDLYRLERESEIAELGLEEVPREDRVLVVEWSQRWTHPTLKPDWEIAFEHVDRTRRKIELHRRGKRPAA